MNETGQDARDSFLAESGDAARRARGRRPMRVLAAPAVAAVAVAAVAWLAASVSQAPSPLAAVKGALAKTSAESYSFTLHSTVTSDGSETNWGVVFGAFDPGHELGAESVTTLFAKHTVRAQIRFVGKYVYTRISSGSRLQAIGKPWDEAPAAAGRPANSPYGFVSDRPVSPAEFSGVLRAADTVRDEGHASGRGWAGPRYAFTARLSDGTSVSGTVYVDQQGRIRRLVTITMEGGVTTDRDLTFGDFGAPVLVAAPPVSQVKYTSEPYWGFFF
jgi:hypothetical protein